MASRLVSLSLVSSLLVASAMGAFPMLGGLGFGNPFMPYNMFQNKNQNPNQQQVDPNMMTCIGADIQDVQSQIRLTITPANTQGQMNHLNPMGIGFGAMGGQTDQNMPQDWTVHGVLLPSQLVQKAGSYQVGVFEGGRTFGECKTSALGQVLSTNSNPFMAGGMGMPGLPPMSPLVMGMGFNPFMSSMMGGAQQQQPTGIVSNPAIISTGTSMYSGMIRQVSFNDLVGRSMGVCQTIHGGQCYGLIPYCCSITRDTISAGEVFVDPIASGGVNTVAAPGLLGGGLMGNGLAAPGGIPGGIPGAGVGAPIGVGVVNPNVGGVVNPNVGAVVGGDGGLF